MTRVWAAALLMMLGCAHARAQDQEPAPPPERRDTPPVVDWDDHPMLRFGSGTYVELKARMQLHHRESAGALGDPAGDDLARRRLGIQGRLGGVVGFEFDREIGDDEPWRDVYLDYRQFDAVRVRGGRFKLPFSLDENTSATDLDFVLRSRAAEQLAPGRDTGVLVHGRLLGNRLHYEAGSFAHDGTNARRGNPERVHGARTWAGRVTATPSGSRSRSRLGDVEAGAAVTSSTLSEGFAALRGRTAMEATFFDSDYWVRGLRRRVGLEARWRPGPFSVQSEYIRVTTERRGQSVEDGDLSPLVARGWYASATWLLTGERKSEGADRPRRPFLRGGIGSIELASRIEYLAFSSLGRGEAPSSSPRAEVVVGNADRAATIGINWHPWRWVKVQANVIRESIADPAQGPMPVRPAFWSRVFRFQIAI